MLDVPSFYKPHLFFLSVLCRLNNNFNRIDKFLYIEILFIGKRSCILAPPWKLISNYDQSNISIIHMFLLVFFELAIYLRDQTFYRP